MFCNRCGQQLEPNAAFCAQCGQPAPAERGAAAPPPAARAAAPAAGMAPVGRVRRHLNAMGVLLLILGILRLPAGLILFGVMQVHHMPWMHYMGMPWAGLAGAFISGIGLWILASAALAIVAGVGLLQRAAWARMTAIVAAIVLLPDLPFGTALGIYVLVILLGDAAESEWAGLSAARLPAR